MSGCRVCVCRGAGGERRERGVGREQAAPAEQPVQDPACSSAQGPEA